MQIANNVPLSEILWYKIGGNTRYLITVDNEYDIQEAASFLKKEKIVQYFIVGLGANLLFSDSDFDGAVIQMKSKKNQGISFHGKHSFSAFAGVQLDDLIQYAFTHSLIGLSWAGGLPSSLGAAVRGNVGAFGGEAKDVVQSARVVNLQQDTYEVKEFSNTELSFSYRDSIIKQRKGLVVISATFFLQAADAAQLQKEKDIYQANITYRKINHPNEYPNTGSVFKNIVQKEDVERVISVFPDIRNLVTTKWHGKVSMGYIIKRLGFSGFQIGGAQVSEKHCNFIDNVDRAKAADVIAIIHAIQEKFQQTFGFIPGPEVEIVTQ